MSSEKKIEDVKLVYLVLLLQIIVKFLQKN